MRSLLGGVRLSAPALVCGGILAYNFAEGSGTALCSFAGMEDSVLKVLPAAPGIGIAFQMRDGTTRVVRGGTCSGTPVGCRSAFRGDADANEETVATSWRGFRIACPVCL